MDVITAAPPESAPQTNMTRPAQRAMLAAYTLTIFLTSGLLFLVQPMVGKILLPRLGGSPAVWNTAMVFFQLTLLVGYAWAHLSLSLLRIRPHVIVTMGLFGLTLLTLPVALPQDWVPTSSPALWVLFALLVLVGGPFLVLASMSPTLQRWLSLSRHPHGSDPYFLYAASNAGSLLGLLAYPLIIEPALTTADQTVMWSWMYAGAAVAVAICGVAAIRFRRPPRPSAATEVPADNGGFQWRWIGLSAVPAALLLAVTHHITTDVAAVPLLWVIPLAIYLVTFIVAFGPNPRWLQRGSAMALKLLVAPLALTFIVGVPLGIGLVVNLGVFTAAALLMHSLLADSRPAAADLTRYYLAVSVGGAIGGTLTALVAPTLFPVVLEYPVAVALALAFIPVAIAGFGGSARSRIIALVVSVVGLVAVVALAGDVGDDALIGIVVGIILIAVYVVSGGPRQYAVAVGIVLVGLTLLPLRSAVVADRSFFGVVRVERTADQTTLWSGSTVHGLQLSDPADAGIPTSYYHPTGPLGDVMVAPLSDSRQIAVIGLGAATIVAYGHSGDHFTFYEIDPTMARIAEDPELFTFIADTAASVDIAIGDGRLLLEQDENRYDVVIIDAFSSDAIPAHLITTEAMALYVDHLAPGGVVAYHVSNRHLDLTPIVARQADALGFASVVRFDRNVSAAESAQGKEASTWIVVAPSEESLSAVASHAEWVGSAFGEGTPLWTDSFSNVISALR